MRTALLLLGLLIAAPSFAGTWVNIPMDKQINIGLGDAIYTPIAPYFLTFEQGAEPEGFARLHMPQSGWPTSRHTSMLPARMLA